MATKGSRIYFMFLAPPPSPYPAAGFATESAKDSKHLAILISYITAKTKGHDGNVAIK